MIGIGMPISQSAMLFMVFSKIKVAPGKRALPGAVPLRRPVAPHPLHECVSPPP